MGRQDLEDMVSVRAPGARLGKQERKALAVSNATHTPVLWNKDQEASFDPLGRRHWPSLREWEREKQDNSQWSGEGVQTTSVN